MSSVWKYASLSCIRKRCTTQAPGIFSLERILFECNVRKVIACHIFVTVAWAPVLDEGTINSTAG